MTIFIIDGGGPRELMRGRVTLNFRASTATTRINPESLKCRQTNCFGFLPVDYDLQKAKESVDDRKLEFPVFSLIFPL